MASIQRHHSWGGVSAHTHTREHTFLLIQWKYINERTLWCLGSSTTTTQHFLHPHRTQTIRIPRGIYAQTLQRIPRVRSKIQANPTCRSILSCALRCTCRNYEQKHTNENNSHPNAKPYAQHRTAPYTPAKPANLNVFLIIHTDRKARVALFAKKPSN